MFGRQMILGAAALALSWAATTAPANAQDPFQFELRRISDDIYVAVRPEGTRTPVDGNATIIINEADVVVVDANVSQTSAARVIALIRGLTDKPVSTLVNTHWHGDHNLGNVVYAREFPGVEIIAHQATFEAMTGEAMQYVADFREAVTGDTTEIDEARANRVRELEEEGADPAVIAWARRYNEQDSAASDAQYRISEVIAPTLTFEKKLVLNRPGRRIELMMLGRANTDGDAVIYLPDDRVVVTGDIVVHPSPYGFGSYPAEWIDTLQAIRDLEWDHLVPGHGEIQTDDAYLALLQRLMKAAGERTAEAVREGLESAEGVRAAVDLSDFQTEISGGDPLLAYLFDIYFWTPILESTYRQAVGAEVVQGQ